MKLLPLKLPTAAKIFHEKILVGQHFLYAYCCLPFAMEFFWSPRIKNYISIQGRVSLDPKGQSLLLNGGMASFKKFCKHTAVATVALHVSILVILGLQNLATIIPKELRHTIKISINGN
ncbi:hypothetical protein CEXT_470461 [Caerostris extrusa]|uniref:Uncharacterized protein n=1 Tax=Caerostris extrusa TaxID=172846 RepID=A0AAV4XAQ1_CAEEX|nr:hypothetical protein CEXT_470461 [Caerostris extrusa]